MIAAALGAPHDAFDVLVASASPDRPEAPLRHHSRLQINNYPSQLRAGPGERRGCPIRASRHFDTSMLTVLCREPWVDDGAVAAGVSGALEVFDASEQRWICIPSPPGEVTVFLGNLAALLTGFALQGTTHRVSNPSPMSASDARRLSIGFNLKPDYTAKAMPPPAVRRALPGLPRVREEDVPLIGLVGRIGWQSHAMQTRGLSRLEAVSTFKTWKNDTVARLREDSRYGQACVF